MGDYKICLASLGDTTEEDAEIFAVFCDAVAEKLGIDAEFFVDTKMSGMVGREYRHPIAGAAWERSWWLEGAEREGEVAATAALLDTDECRAW